MTLKATTLICQKKFLWKSAIFHSIKLPFDAEVAEKILNAIYWLPFLVELSMFLQKKVNSLLLEKISFDRKSSLVHTNVEIREHCSCTELYTTLTDRSHTEQIFNVFLFSMFFFHFHIFIFQIDCLF